jgi:nucleoside-diphosphate-sugar epimerase
MLPPIAHYPQLLAQANVHFSPQTPWIFVSSTSVYREGEITEQSPRDGNSGNAPLLIACEQYLESIQRPCCIVRPSGLFDDIRRPGGFFKNSNSIPNASSPINLVHSQDVARFLWHVILRQLWGEQFNLSCDDHPLKKDFYAPLLLKNYGKKIALDETSKTTKIISNLKSRQTGFEYLYPSLAKYQASI